jgi:hypothetical protein
LYGYNKVLTISLKKSRAFCSAHICWSFDKVFSPQDPLHELPKYVCVVPKYITVTIAIDDPIDCEKIIWRSIRRSKMGIGALHGFNSNKFYYTSVVSRRWRWFLSIRRCQILCPKENKTKLSNVKKKLLLIQQHNNNIFAQCLSLSVNKQPTPIAR